MDINPSYRNICKDMCCNGGTVFYGPGIIMDPEDNVLLLAGKWMYDYCDEIETWFSSWVFRFDTYLGLSALFQMHDPDQHYESEEIYKHVIKNFLFREEE